MTETLGFAQTFAAAMLAIAAASKIVARVDLTPFLIASGLPKRLSRVIAPLVPPAEAALAALLVAGILVLWVTITALALSLGFVAMQIRSFRSAEPHGCRCFGHLDSDERGLAVFRAVLLAGALLVAMFSLPFGATQSNDVARVFGGLSGVGIVIASGLIGQVVRFERERARTAGA